MTKRRVLRLTGILIGSAALLFLGARFYYVFIETQHCNENFIRNNDSKYFSLFDSSKTRFLTCEYSIGNSKEKKYRFLYTYKKEYKYFIVEDARLNNITIANIRDTIDTFSLMNVYIDPSEINDLFWGGHTYFQSKLCIDSSNKLVVKIHGDSNIIVKDSVNWKSINGLFRDILIQNENNEIQYRIRFDFLTQTSIIFYKPKSILYLILITPFDSGKEIKNSVSNLNLR